MENFIFPDAHTLSRPFRFIEPQQPNHARIGGNMPEGLSTVSLNPNAEYFGTFPLYEGNSNLYFSLFINCTFEEFLKSHGEIQSDNRIVLITHVAKPRSSSKEYASKLSEAALHIEDAQPDRVQDDEGEEVPKDGHKFGGHPYCVQDLTLEGAEELFAQGYKQVLQVDFPSRLDCDISGDWPFGDGVFNLFWKYPFEGEPVYWCLQI